METAYFWPAGECPPCQLTSSRTCQCGAETAALSCSVAPFQCDRVCDAALGCGRHRCERRCHAGACGSCPEEGVRHCPCGKVGRNLPYAADAAVSDAVFLQRFVCEIKLVALLWFFALGPRMPLPEIYGQTECGDLCPLRHHNKNKHCPNCTVRDLEGGWVAAHL